MRSHPALPSPRIPTGPGRARMPRSPALIPGRAEPEAGRCPHPPRGGAAPPPPCPPPAGRWPRGAPCARGVCAGRTGAELRAGPGAPRGAESGAGGERRAPAEGAGTGGGGARAAGAARFAPSGRGGLPRSSARRGAAVPGKPRRESRGAERQLVLPRGSGGGSRNGVSKYSNKKRKL